ncbi:MAG: DUF1648 domain-containing protein [Candidatus Zixiibacteriota bacterium]
MTKIVQILWWMTIALLIAQSLYYYPLLPESMASHFDGQGTPDSYAPKSQFIIIWYCLIVFLNIWVILPRILMKKLPVELINVPNKAYWVSTPERRMELARMVSTVMEIIFVAVNLLMLYAFYYTVMVNLGQAPAFSIGWMIIVVLAIVAMSIFYMVRRTRMPA